MIAVDRKNRSLARLSPVLCTIVHYEFFGCARARQSAKSRDFVLLHDVRALA